MSFERTELNHRIQAYLRANALRASDHERIGPFLASFDRHSDNIYRNYAVPDDGAVPDAGDIAALIAAFAQRERRPRFEYISDAAPAVAPALQAQGFEIEKAYPILVCTPELLREPRGVDGLVTLAENDSDIVGAAEAGAEAYGEKESNPHALRGLVAQGGVLAVARDTATQTVIGLGMATPAHEGVSEVAGIGVRHQFRRRGLAGALTARVTREAFARGVTLAWLTPGHDDAERIYGRAGFVRASEQLHISRPA